MNNVNYITRAHPEYYILKQRIAFRVGLGIPRQKVMIGMIARHSLNAATADLLFTPPKSWYISQSVRLNCGTVLPHFGV